MKKIPQKFNKWFKSHFLDERDIIDLEHEYDSELTIGENMEAFKEKFVVYYYENQQEIKAKVKAEAENQENEGKINGIRQRKAYLEERFGVKLNFVG